MIRISNLNKQFGSQILFDDCEVSIYDKEKIGLIGRNGTGKSTLLKIIEKRDTSDCDIHFDKSIIISSLEQNLDFEHSTLLEQVASKLQNPEIETWQAESTLQGLGFNKEDFQKHPKQFSSGFQIRIRLAEALLKDCDLLLLDEPTNYLDILSLRWLKSFLNSWNKALILVTHDKNFMQDVITHTIGIHRSKLRKLKGSPDKLLEQIQLEETVHEKTRKNQLKKQERTEEFIRKFRAGARSAGLVQSRIKSLEKQEIYKTLEYIPQINFKFNYKLYEGNTLIKVENLNFSYDETDIIKNLSFNTLPGDKIAIIGRNGKGKSTLLKLLAGTLESIPGSIKTNPSLQIGYFGQDSKESLNPNNSILSEFTKLPNITEQEARKMCSLLLFNAEAIKKPIKVLSGGEKNRVALGKAILQTTQILLLDEPSNHLDLESAQALINAMQEFKGLLIFVSHDEDMLTKVANKLIIFEDNKQIVYNENYQSFLKNIGWKEETTFLATNKTTSSESSAQQLREIKKQINKIERQLQKLEKEETSNNDLLQQACLDKDHEKIKSYGIKSKEIHDQIHNLYAEFEDLLNQESVLQA